MGNNIEKAENNTIKEGNKAEKSGNNEIKTENIETKAENKPRRRATVKDLIEKGHKKKERKNKAKVIYSEVLDSELVFKNLSDRDVLDILERHNIASIEDSFVGNYDLFAELMYTCCNELHEQELHDEFGVKDPLDIVGEIFEINEVINHGGKLLSFIFNTEKTEEIKK